MTRDLVFVAERSPDGRPALASKSGARLVEMCGLRSLEELRKTADVVNLMPPGSRSWDNALAREMAAVLLKELSGSRFILLGQRVVKAWGMLAVDRYSWHPYGEHGESQVATMPHPSGKCREWNDRAELRRAQAFLRPLFKGNGR